MKERAVSDPCDLNRPPHILLQLIDIATGKLQPSPAEQEQRWQHLTECVYCQAFLGSYLLETIESAPAHDASGETARKLLDKLMIVMHKTIKGDIPAYVEIAVGLNEEEANQRFPLLVEHLRTCQCCWLEVRDLHIWLQHLGQAESL